MGLNSVGCNWIGITNVVILTSKPQYVLKTWRNGNIQPPTKPQHAPDKWNTKTYGAHSQLAPIEEDSLPLSEDKVKHIPRVLGIFPHCANDNTILTAVNESAMSQAEPTETTIDKVESYSTISLLIQKRRYNFYQVLCSCVSKAMLRILRHPAQK